MSETSFDVIIIGGGAAGIMAAISAKKHHPTSSVAILDRTHSLGRKILVCGAGRCNLTNVNLAKDFAQHYYGAEPEFINSVFTQFSYQDILAFFHDLGIATYVERKTDIGKVFPETNQAQTVTALLLDELARLDVKVFVNTEVVSIEASGGANTTSAFQIRAKNEEGELSFSCAKLVLAAGGQTYPALGSNGSGYALAAALGHTIVKPVPSALPLVAKSALTPLLQGVKLDVEATSIIDGQEVKTRTDDVMFTQYGLSGPAILNISREISIQLNREEKSGVEVKLNFFPGLNKDTLRAKLEEHWAKRPDQKVNISLYGTLPTKVADAICRVLGFAQSQIVGELSPADKVKLLEALTNYRIPVTATRSWNEAEFTAGGVDTREVKPTTLESKLIPGLYFAGEVLDVDGDVGGFNLSWAWSSGWVAGSLS